MAVVLAHAADGAEVFVGVAISADEGCVVGAAEDVDAVVRAERDVDWEVGEAAHSQRFDIGKAATEQSVGSGHGKSASCVACSGGAGRVWPAGGWGPRDVIGLLYRCGARGSSGGLGQSRFLSSGRAGVSPQRGGRVWGGGVGKGARANPLRIHSVALTFGLGRRAGPSGGTGGRGLPYFF